MPDIHVENAIRSVLARIEAAWREKKFDALEECFDESAVIVGPNYAEYAVADPPAPKVIESLHAMRQYMITQNPNTSCARGRTRLCIHLLGK
jgi:hypothetical protein